MDIDKDPKITYEISASMSWDRQESILDCLVKIDRIMEMVLDTFENEVSNGKLNYLWKTFLSLFENLIVKQEHINYTPYFIIYFISKDKTLSKVFLELCYTKMASDYITSKERFFFLITIKL